MNSKKQAKNKNNTVKTQLLCILLFLLALAGFHLLTVIDNKYSKDYYEIRDGVLLADAQALNHDKLLYLTEGWEIYPDRLLSPQDFLSSSVSENGLATRIGEYMNFAGFHQGILPTVPPPTGSDSPLPGSWTVWCCICPKSFRHAGFISMVKKRSARGAYSRIPPWSAILSFRFLTARPRILLSRPPTTAIITAELYILRYWEALRPSTCRPLSVWYFTVFYAFFLCL